MKKNQVLKSVSMLMLLVLVSFSASAQKIFSAEEMGVNVFKASECREFLKAGHETDTLVSVYAGVNDTVCRRTVFLQEQKLHAKVEKITKKEICVVRENRQVSSVDTASVNTLVVEGLVKDQKRDVIMAYSPTVAEARREQTGSDAGKVVLKGANKYGWGVEVLAGYQLAENLNSFAVGGGLKYDRSWWGIYLHGEAGKSRYSSNAVQAGEDYWVFRAESALMFQPFKFDAFNQNRLFFFGGVGFESMETDSKPYTDPETGVVYEGKSWGNALYPTAGIRFEHRFFATGNSIGAAVQWRQLTGVLQNQNNDKYNAVMFSLFFNFGVNRNKVNNK